MLKSLPIRNNFPVRNYEFKLIYPDWKIKKGPIQGVFQTFAELGLVACAWAVFIKAYRQFVGSLGKLLIDLYSKV